MPEYFPNALYIHIHYIYIYIYIYSPLRKYSAPLNFATFCHISGFKHIVKNQQQVGHNHEVERHLLDISNFFNKSKLKNWACKIIQPLNFQCSKLSPEVQ